MQDGPQTSFEYVNSTATGWLLSCLVHGGLALAAIFFVQRIHLAPQGAPFHWNVAMEAPPSPSVEASAPIDPAIPPTKRLPSPIRSVQRIESRPVASASPAQITEMAPPVQQVEPLPNESRTPEPIAAVAAHSSPRPVPSPEHAEHASAPHTDTSQSPLPPLDGNPSSDPSLSANTPVASVSSQRSATVDYGWLASLMAQWIEGLHKRYPAALRAEGIEGRVMLIALLHEDGSLSDVRIVKGSGNPALDQVALEDVTNGPPIKLSRALERPQISVKFSISYDLKTAH